jgi:DNA-directed RNA polymerase specialized sigma24 family protein
MTAPKYFEDKYTTGGYPRLELPPEEQSREDPDPLSSDPPSKLVVRNNSMRLPMHNAQLIPKVNRSAVRARIHSIIKEYDAVDEVEQRVAVKWLEKRWRWKILKSDQAYAIRLAENEAKRWLANQRRRAVRFSELALLYAPLGHPLLQQASEDSIADNADPVEIEQLKAYWLAKMSPRIREVFELRMLGYEVQEIADHLKIKLSTAQGYVCELIDIVMSDDEKKVDQSPNSVSSS